MSHVICFICLYNKRAMNIILYSLLINSLTFLFLSCSSISIFRISFGSVTILSSPPSPDLSKATITASSISLGTSDGDPISSSMASSRWNAGLSIALEIFSFESLQPWFELCSAKWSESYSLIFD